MPKHQEQVKSRLLTDEAWVEIFERAAVEMKNELAHRMLDCPDDELYELRAESRVLRRLLSSVRREVYQDE